MAVVLITGANRGIGLELARQYAAEGWRVHACCRRPAEASELVAALKGHDGLVHALDVTDGAAISANLGVNPSLSITAQAERAAALWPNKGEQDQRPAQGEPYRRISPVPPTHPVVPATAPGALRSLPIIPVSSA